MMQTQLLRFVFALVATMALLFAGATTARANPVLIDDFSVDQGPLVVNPGNPNEIDSVSGGGILGGERTVQVQHFAGSGNTTFLSSGGQGSYSEDTVDTDGQATLIYDGAGAGGLGGEDLTGGAMNDQILLRVQPDSATSFQITLTIEDTSANSDTAPLILPPAGSFQLFTVPFSAFPSVDLTLVDSIILSIDIDTNQDTDVSIDFIQANSSAPIPEPSTLLLSTFGLITLGGFVWRRR